MTCSQANSLLSPYLDGAVTGKEMRALTQHMDTCAYCRQEYASLRQTQLLLSQVGRRKAPDDLALKLRLAISRESAQSRHSYFDGARVRLENAINAFMVRRPQAWPLQW